MQFSIWHWAIVLLLIGVPVFFAVRSASKPSQNPEQLAGFGGWLMLLAIGQTLAPFRTLADLFSSSEGYRQLLLLPNGPLAVCGEIVLLLAVCRPKLPTTAHRQQWSELTYHSSRVSVHKAHIRLCCFSGHRSVDTCRVGLLDSGINIGAEGGIEWPVKKRMVPAGLSPLGQP
ncbi:hypothetical protein [Mesorhizobium sp. BR1-1-2]|uniref:hypothetical protein n=1 Tax=Mesorhizobium sp. BR1-1-2 TaxID=2876652 RepID=UPI001CCF0F11|nr:hypothetical protein [Mesorhizobium sp. BR1-1-2]MBZ9962956.1 hypothetical protein [Mesorhizobium sp. BR1-1-2]